MQANLGMDTMDRHKSTVERIRSRVAHFYTTKTAFRVYHGSTNSTRHADFDRAAIVDVSALDNVLSIDPATRIAVVEPNVPMDVLVRETMKANLLPPVVMEFPGITVGGGFVGTAGESSSFKYGFFDRTVLSAEVVLANGDVMQASPTKN
jgi:delta24-sterol reductase